MPVKPPGDLKGHVCPPSTATHPSGRWETLFVYSFICKFTTLRGKVEGFETAMDLETALLSREPNAILTSILGRFVSNLRPMTRNLSIDQISTTVSAVLGEYLKTNERTTYWDEALGRNVDPFKGLDGGFFASDWSFKLQVLRQLVELQLSHAPDIKASIDHAWGVNQLKHKKREVIADHPTQEQLQLVPIGQDAHRLRYWVADESPRIYTSTNPWKISASFYTASSTLEEYLSVIDGLKKNAPADDDEDDDDAPQRHHKSKRSKLAQGHINLISALEARIEAIEAEQSRVQRARRKLELREIALAQAELRQTRTRRQTRRPDYTYANDGESEEDEQDEYTYGDHENGLNDDDFIDDADDDEFGGASSTRNGGHGHRKSARASSSRHPVPATNGQRRSTRAAVLNGNAKRTAPSDDSHHYSEWRGERRSTRLGHAPPADNVSGPSSSSSNKRARTEESTVSMNSATGSGLHSSPPPGAAPVISANGIKTHGAAAIKPTETAVEKLAGQKRSKYWYYAVEPIPGAAPLPQQRQENHQDHADLTTSAPAEGWEPPNTDDVKSENRKHQNGISTKGNGHHHQSEDVDMDDVDMDTAVSSTDYHESLQGDLSPVNSP